MTTVSFVPARIGLRLSILRTSTFPVPGAFAERFLTGQPLPRQVTVTFAPRVTFVRTSLRTLVRAPGAPHL